MMTWEEKMAWGKETYKSWKCVPMDARIIDEMFMNDAEIDGIKLEEDDIYAMTDAVLDGEWDNL